MTLRLDDMATNIILQYLESFTIKKIINWETKCNKQQIRLTMDLFQCVLKQLMINYGI